jgi:hypothetical protein
LQGGDTVVDGSTGLVGIKSGQKVINDGVVYQASDSCVPVIIAAYSSHLEVTAGRIIAIIFLNLILYIIIFFHNNIYKCQVFKIHLITLVIFYHLNLLGQCCRPSKKQ